MEVFDYKFYKEKKKLEKFKSQFCLLVSFFHSFLDQIFLWFFLSGMHAAIFSSFFSPKFQPCIILITCFPIAIEATRQLSMGELEVDRKGSLWKRVTDYVLTKTPLFKHLILKKARENVSYQLKF